MLTILTIAVIIGTVFMCVFTKFSKPKKTKIETIEFDLWDDAEHCTEYSDDVPFIKMVPKDKEPEPKILTTIPF